MQLFSRRPLTFGVTFGAALLSAGLVTPSHADESSAPALRAVALSAPARPIQLNMDSSSMRPVSVEERAANFVRLNVDCAGGSAKKQLGEVAALSPFPVAFRIGANLSPRTLFDVGVDVNLPSLHLIPEFSSRVDLDAIIGLSIASVSTIFPLTFDQLYGRTLAGGTRVYAGAGIGPYFGGVTRFGGKLILGADFTSRLGGEFNVHFAGTGDPLLSLQLRVGL